MAGARRIESGRDSAVQLGLGACAIGIGEIEPSEQRMRQAPIGIVVARLDRGRARGGDIAGAVVLQALDKLAPGARRIGRGAKVLYGQHHGDDQRDRGDRGPAADQPAPVEPQLAATTANPALARRRALSRGGHRISAGRTGSVG